jgi:hypothetical protein
MLLVHICVGPAHGLSVKRRGHWLCEIVLSRVIKLVDLVFSHQNTVSIQVGTREQHLENRMVSPGMRWPESALTRQVPGFRA